MKLLIAAVGRLRSAGFAAAAGEYLRRLGRYAAHHTAEVREESGDAPAARAREAERLAALLRDGDFLVLCDERGQELTSAGLAAFLARRERAGPGRTVFAVGGPYGVDPALRRRAGLVLSLSRLTLPHELARVVLIEALYRAFTILRGEKYHHG